MCSLQYTDAPVVGVPHFQSVSLGSIPSIRTILLNCFGYGFGSRAPCWDGMGSSPCGTTEISPGFRDLSDLLNLYNACLRVD